VPDRVVGRIPVLECLRANKRVAHRLFLLESAKGVQAIRDAAARIPVQECTRRDLDALSEGVVHQGVVLEADPLPVVPLADWVNGALPSDAVVAILDGIEDPHNFGAIVRSAAACGASAVVFAKDRAAPISPVSVKSAAGAMEHVELVRAGNLARGLDALKAAGFWITGLEADAPQLIWDVDLTGRVGLVIGGEGKGVRRLVRERCDFLVRIPLSGAITSLNASVSAGIALAECLRQRMRAADS
jgi:23S rRNA (guanosine2251-2'-O)-methyltransferase